jgi:hypothetical protein
MVITSFPGGDARPKSGRADRHITEPAALLQVVAEFPLDKVFEMLRKPTAAASAGGVAGWGLRSTPQLRRHTSVNRVADVVLARPAEQPNVATVRVIWHRESLLRFTRRTHSGNDANEALRFRLRQVRKCLVVGTGVRAPVPTLFRLWEKFGTLVA